VLSQVDLQPTENAQSIYLIKLLESSSEFRVRAQAAISLGLTEKSFAARRALTAALRDVHPAVRAAAATSLGRIGEANHVIALRALEGDPEEPVRNAARASIGRLESTIEEAPVVLGTSATTAALSTATSANRM
jgi:HEAT repeat protein